MPEPLAPPSPPPNPCAESAANTSGRPVSAAARRGRRPARTGTAGRGSGFGTARRFPAGARHVGARPDSAGSAIPRNASEPVSPGPPPPPRPVSPLTGARRAHTLRVFPLSPPREHPAPLHDLHSQPHHPVRREAAVRERLDQVLRRQPLRPDRRERQRQVDVHEDPRRRARAHLRHRLARPRAAHGDAQAGPVRLRGAHRARHGDHGSPRALGGQGGARPASTRSPR